MPAKSEVEFSLSEDNSSIDPVVGYTGHAAPWLAITLANADVEQRGPQVIAAQPDADRTTSGSLSSPKKKFARKRLRMTKVKVKTLIGSVVTVAFYDGHRGIFVICLSGKRSFGHGIRSL